MSAAPEPHDPPRAILKGRRRAFPSIWIVPLVAALIAGYMVYDRVRDLGPVVSIKFKDVSGLKPGQTQIKYRGVPVGEVAAVELSEDRRHALVKARLSASAIARDGAVFWIVRPEVGISSITGLGTVISGPEIGVEPGNGKARTEFVGRDSAPPAPEYQGLDIILHAAHLGSLRTNAPVYYRGIEVGIVRDGRLNRKATAVDIHVLIRQRYANLVREGSQFWNASGAEARFSLFRGLEIDIESLRALVAGGVAFATPDAPGAKPAKAGAKYILHNAPKPEWLGWTPEIALPAGD